MAGYLGTRAVLLSTTAAVVTGDMTVAGATTLSGAFTSLGIDDNATSTAITIDANENVGIGVTDPDSALEVQSSASGLNSVHLSNTSSAGYGAKFVGGGATATQYIADFRDYAGASKVKIDGSGNVGIGTASPAGLLELKSTANAYAYITAGDTSSSRLHFGDATTATVGRISYNHNNNNMDFYTNSAERLRIDASGNVLLGKTTADNTTEGFTFYGTHDGVSIVKAEGAPLILNRLTNDGALAVFRKNGSTVGSIGSRSGSSNLFINSTSNSGRLACNSTEKYGWNLTTFWATTDNANDLGSPSSRWDDVYATNGTIQTSDRNEKQDIEVLTAAETAVAVACKGLLRKFRWIDSVTEKGDDARIHFGIIAQDLQDAFTAEGLDAGRYAMFISSTWWEIEVVVPAVEAVAEVLDEDGGVVTEAVDAVDAYTRTDTFDEVTEGATERTRLGVRYPELLAFIIGAL